MSGAQREVGYVCGICGMPYFAGTQHTCYEASKLQVGGDHYKKYPIQPAEYCQKNQLNWCESNIIKYASRHRSKGGAEDVKKIIHYAQLLLEWEYDE